LTCHFPRGVLVTQPCHRVGLRPDEVDVATPADLVEVGILGEEAIARVNRLDVTDFGRANDTRDFEIAVGSPRRPNADGLVGQVEIMRPAIGLAEDGD
jgi:hypothetical protein